MALRPRPSASAISSRYGSQALALARARGTVAWVGGHRRNGVLAGRSRWTPPAWWPVLTDPGRWTPPVWWPVLAATPWPAAAPAHRDPGRLQIGARRLAADRRWPARCGAATIPVARAPGLAAVCCRPRRCSCRRRNIGSSPASTSRLLRVVAGFRGSASRWTPPAWWPVLSSSGRWTPPVWWPVLAATPGVGPPAPDGIGIPAAFRYALAVSRRTAVAGSMRRSDHPSRPSASTCCCLSSPKTLLMPAKEHAFPAAVNVSAATCGGRFSGVHEWPVLGVHRGGAARSGPQTAGARCSPLAKEA